MKFAELLAAHKAKQEAQKQAPQVSPQPIPQSSPVLNSSVLAALANLKARNANQQETKQTQESEQRSQNVQSSSDVSVHSQSTESSSPISVNVSEAEGTIEGFGGDSPEGSELDRSKSSDKFGNTIYYNAKQQEFIDLALSGESCILIGAAGTGKTTCMKGVMQGLITSGQAGQLGNHNHKYLPQGGAPGITVSAYTRRATNNIRKNLSADMQPNALTIHKLLEYQPEYTTEYNDETGREKTTMRFAPARNESNHLPETIVTCAIEEGSMVSVELFRELEVAFGHDVQWIFLGDIQQLPPVFGSAILGYKMLELPVVELTEVYRQALESPIIRLAHRILSGNPIPVEEYPEWKIPGQLTIHPWQKKISADSAVITLSKFFLKMLDENSYNPETDAILIPFNKSCGTDELNKYIAGAVAKRDQKLVYEIIHGFRKSYYSIGDKCLYDREDAIVTNIYPNPQYTGVTPQPESCDLDYWGHKKSSAPKNEQAKSDQDIDFLLGQVGVSNGDDDRVRAASHVVELTLLDSDRTVRIQEAGQLNNLILGYALTVHKSQGSEWDKVFLCFHHSHNTMLSRELLYTAVTRPKKELFVICEPDTFTKGITNQRIKGDTLAEKAEYFKGKLERGELQS